jgi:prolyl-tRNA editing enzyme YbaK/EbsC (Cys-tRNA(Pro) deacylase)
MCAIEKVKQFLYSKDPTVKVIEFEQDTSTSYLAAQALGTEVAQIAKSILLKDKKGAYLLIVSTGDARIDNKKIKQISSTRLRMASADEVLEVTGFPIGGVCPFALKSQVPIYLDDSLRRFPVVYAAAGTANTAVPVSFEQLTAITGGSWCDVTMVP